MKVKSFSFVELIVSISLFATLLITGFFMFSSLSIEDKRGTQVTLAQKMRLSADSRMTFNKLFYRIQEGVEVIRPKVGETKQYLYFRDIVNNVIYCKLTKLEEVDLYTLKTYLIDVDGNEKEEEKPIIIRNIKNITFTPHSSSAIIVHITISNVDLTNKKDGAGEYSLLTTIRLRNANLSENEFKNLALKGDEDVKESK